MLIHTLQNIPKLEEEKSCLFKSPRNTKH